MISIRTTKPATGYFIDAQGKRVKTVVPAGSVGSAGPEGHGDHAGRRCAILVQEGRDVVLPELSDGQYVAL